jgi:hypothetical protein
VSTAEDEARQVDDEQPLTADEQVEFEWLQAREKDPMVKPPSPEVAKRYADLELDLWELESPPLDAAWVRGLLAKTRDFQIEKLGPRPPWWRIMARRKYDRDRLAIVERTSRL